MTPNRDIDTFSRQLAERLPGPWTARPQDLSSPSAQADSAARLWATSTTNWTISDVRRRRAGLLTGPLSRYDTVELLVIDQPTRHQQFFIAPFAPNGFGSFDFLVAPHAPHGIAVDHEPARAAHAVVTRLLPRYQDALRTLRADVIEHAAHAGQSVLHAWDETSDSLCGENGWPLDEEVYGKLERQRDAQVWEHFEAFLDHGPALLAHAEALLPHHGPHNRSDVRQLEEACQTGIRERIDCRIRLAQARALPSETREVARAEIVAERNADSWHAMTQWLDYAPTLLRLARTSPEQRRLPTRRPAASPSAPHPDIPHPRRR